MEIRQLRTFITVADLLNFTNASNRLNMAQSSVSAQIKALEDELNLKLFDRLGRRVLLTEAGRKLYAYARRMDDMTREIRAEFSGAQYAQGALTVRVPETIASVYMPAVIERFHKDHPEVKLELINCSDEQLREELNSGRIDLAFLLTHAIHFKQVNVTPLRTEPLALVAGVSHPLSQLELVEMDRLAGHTLLLPKTD